MIELFLLTQIATTIPTPSPPDLNPPKPTYTPLPKPIYTPPPPKPIYTPPPIPGESWSDKMWKRYKGNK
jgi:hypothetical protein